MNGTVGDVTPMAGAPFDDLLAWLDLPVGDEGCDMSAPTVEAEQSYGRRALAEVLAVTGMTRRQAHYWVAMGWLRPSGKGGSGNAWVWPDGELEVAWRMVRVVKAGLSPSVAHRVARGDTDLGHGVRVVIEGIGA